VTRRMHSDFGVARGRISAFSIDLLRRL